MVMKVNRHAKIIELISKFQIETQEELADHLNKEGFKVTQATVSRDIRDLKLTKVPSENGKQCYATEYSCDQNSCRNGNGSMCCAGCNEMDRDCRKYCGG